MKKDVDDKDIHQTDNIEIYSTQLNMKYPDFKNKMLKKELCATVEMEISLSSGAQCALIVIVTEWNSLYMHVNSYIYYTFI